MPIRITRATLRAASYVNKPLPPPNDQPGARPRLWLIRWDPADPRRLESSPSYAADVGTRDTIPGRVWPWLSRHLWAPRIAVVCWVPAYQDPAGDWVKSAVWRAPECTLEAYRRAGLRHVAPTIPTVMLIPPGTTIQPAADSTEPLELQCENGYDYARAQRRRRRNNGA